jgi:ACS family D-galactonate transporter-like MFS transporter
MTNTATEPSARRWKPWYGLWGWLLIGWVVSAADRALTGPVITWMIQNEVSFLAGVENPYGLAGLIGGLFFAGYMLTQFPGGYLGDRYGHRTMIVVSLLWAGIATLLTGLLTGLVAFIALRVITGLGEGAYYSNDRSLIAESTPVRQRSLGLGVVITGLSIGITVATIGTPGLISLGGVLGSGAWRMPFLVLGLVTTAVAVALWMRFRRDGKPMPMGKATVHLLKFSAISFAAIMGIYFAGSHLHLSNLWIAVIEVSLALALVLYALLRKGEELAPVVRNRDLLLIYIAAIAILWNLWFFGFWATAIVAGAAKTSFLQAALVAGFNAGAGILGFPAGGWLSDYAVRRGWGRKPMLVTFTAIQAVLTFAFAWYSSTGTPSMWVMAALLFITSLFFNALQPISQALTADIASAKHRGAAFGMWNLIGEIGAVLSPAISGVLRDATGDWTAATYLDASIVLISLLALIAVRERRATGAAASAPLTVTGGRA